MSDEIGERLIWIGVALLACALLAHAFFQGVL